MSESLIRRVARHREASSEQLTVRYDARRGISFVLENGAWVESYRSQTVPQSKKADIETGEDQKGE